MVFSKLRAALKKTRDVLTKGLSRLFSFGRKLDDSFLDELEHVLYQSDLGPLGTRLVEQLKVAYKNREIADVAQVPGFLRTLLLQRLEGEIGRAHV